MRWLKHMVGSRRDPDIFAAREELGGDAVDIFWSTVELMSEECENGESEVVGSPLFFRNQIPGHSMSKIKKVWAFFGAEKREKQRILFKEEGDKIILCVPKAKELASHYNAVVRRNRKPITKTGEKKGPVAPTPVPVRKEQENIPFKEILGHLNAKTGRTYGMIEAHKSMIRSRWKEGFRLKDFIAAIDNQCREWTSRVCTTVK